MSGWSFRTYRRCGPQGSSGVRCRVPGAWLLGHNGVPVPILDVPGRSRPGLVVPCRGIPEGPAVTGLSSPRTATSRLSGWVCPGGQQLPGVRDWSHSSLVPAGGCEGDAWSCLLPMNGGAGVGAGEGKARGFPRGVRCVEDVGGVAGGAEALARALGTPGAVEGALPGVSPSADRRCLKLPACSLISLACRALTGLWHARGPGVCCQDHYWKPAFL